MADESDQKHGATASGGVDPVTLALIGASREKADALLERQRQLLDLQIEDAREQRGLHLSHLRLRRFSDYSEMALEIAVGLFLLAVVGGLGVMFWQASKVDGLVLSG